MHLFAVCEGILANGAAIEIGLHQFHSVLGLPHPVVQTASGTFECLCSLPGQGLGGVFREPFGIPLFYAPADEDAVGDSSWPAVVEFLRELSINSDSLNVKGTERTVL